jgi:hypothetical protein
LGNILDLGSSIFIGGDIFRGGSDLIDQPIQFVGRVEPDLVLLEDSLNGDLLVIWTAPEFPDDNQLKIAQFPIRVLEQRASLDGVFARSRFCLCLGLSSKARGLDKVESPILEAIGYVDVPVQDGHLHQHVLLEFLLQRRRLALLIEELFETRPPLFAVLPANEFLEESLKVFS